MTVYFLLAHYTIASMVVNWLEDQIFTLDIKNIARHFLVFRWAWLHCSLLFESCCCVQFGGKNWLNNQRKTATWAGKILSPVQAWPGREPSCLHTSDLILHLYLMQEHWATSTEQHSVVSQYSVNHNLSFSCNWNNSTVQRIFQLTLESRGTNNECLLEGVSLCADLGGSRLQGNTLLCHSCNWCCRWWIQSRLVV